MTLNPNQWQFERTQLGTVAEITDMGNEDRLLVKLDSGAVMHLIDGRMGQMGRASILRAGDRIRLTDESGPILMSPLR